ncbi:MAG: M24 family metallopeptidase, partial [Candidatus Lokiarchaeota archaeon]|nr:M24 family metallopeptidase [Candidatus Lokiarchaeota archaeon]
FFHGLGHSLGFEAHDIGSRISWKVSEHHILKENMVYTNEPGLYWLDKWGIRLEDDVIIGKDKCEQVTSVSKEPIVI